MHSVKMTTLTPSTPNHSHHSKHSGNRELAVSSPQPRVPAMKILFIGNSFTARNDLPALLAALAASRGHTIEPDLVSAGGTSLRAHWNKGVAVTAIQQGKLDYVVLQEQSTLPVRNATRMHENIRLFDEVIKMTGARTVLYLTWSRVASPDAQGAISDAYQCIADELGALVVPVGVAWSRRRAGAHVPAKRAQHALFGAQAMVELTVAQVLDRHIKLACTSNVASPHR
jgi:hypothetical protein